MNKVVFIGAGPGDPELITLKGKKWLEQADVVIHAGSLLAMVAPHRIGGYLHLTFFIGFPRNQSGPGNIQRQKMFYAASRHTGMAAHASG